MTRSLPTSQGGEAHTLVGEATRRLNKGERSNELDVLIEVAAFRPCDVYSAARSNNARSKVIYTRRDGSDETCWAPDWSLNPLAASEALRKASPQGGEG